MRQSETYLNSTFVRSAAKAEFKRRGYHIIYHGTAALGMLDSAYHIELQREKKKRNVKIHDAFREQLQDRSEQYVEVAARKRNTSPVEENENKIASCFH